MKEYVIQEGTFSIPEFFVDRTVNTFVSGVPGKSQFNFTLSRDTSDPEETLEAYVDRQVRFLKNNIKGYRLVHQQICTLGHRHEGIEVYGTWKEGKQVIYQRQAAFIFSANTVVIFSATSGKVFAKQEDEYWLAWLNSFH